MPARPRPPHLPSPIPLVLTTTLTRRLRPGLPLQPRQPHHHLRHHQRRRPRQQHRRPPRVATHPGRLHRPGVHHRNRRSRRVRRGTQRRFGSRQHPLRRGSRQPRSPGLRPGRRSPAHLRARGRGAGRVRRTAFHRLGRRPAAGAGLRHGPNHGVFGPRRCARPAAHAGPDRRVAAAVPVLPGGSRRGLRDDLRRRRNAAGPDVRRPRQPGGDGGHPAPVAGGTTLGNRVRVQRGMGQFLRHSLCSEPGPAPRSRRRDAHGHEQRLPHRRHTGLRHPPGHRTHPARRAHLGRGMGDGESGIPRLHRRDAGRRM